MDEHLSSSVTAPNSLPSNTQEAFDQQTSNDDKSGGPSPSLAAASSPAAVAAAAAASGPASMQAATLGVNQLAAEEPMRVDHPNQTAGVSKRAVAEDQGMLQSSPAGRGRTEQPGQDAAGPSSSSAGVPTEGVKLGSSSGRVRMSSGGNLEKKSSRDDKREADRKPSRAKRQRSRSRSQSDSPKR